MQVHLTRPHGCQRPGWGRTAPAGVGGAQVATLPSDQKEQDEGNVS